jgi:hypothetical protein
VCSDVDIAIFSLCIWMYADMYHVYMRAIFTKQPRVRVARRTRGAAARAEHHHAQAQCGGAGAPAAGGADG